MNARKRAWQILHTEVRRRLSDGTFDDAANANIGAIIRTANSEINLISELAGFAATFLQMNRDSESALKLADIIGAKVMHESDEEDDHGNR